jgi:signal transduction histidine kinase
MPFTPNAGTHPPPVAGVVVAAICVAAETALGTLLAGTAAAQTLNVVYVPGIVLVSFLWGLRFGLGTAVVSTIMFDLFVTPPAWSLRPGGDAFLATLSISLIVAALAGTVAALTRSLTAESEARADADLSTRFAGLLRGRDVRAALPAVTRQPARAFGLPSASISAEAVPADEAHSRFPLRGDDTLVVPSALATRTLRRLRERAAPPLGMLLQAAREREKSAGAERSDCAEFRRIADEQAALRNLATLVAHSTPPPDVFDAVAREMAHVLGTPHTVIARYEPDGLAVVVTGTWNYREIVPSGSRWEMEEDTVCGLVFRTRKPGRVDAYHARGRLSSTLRERGVFSSVGCPIIVGCDLWGVAIASSTTPQPLPPDTERRMLEFTELAATAIANAQHHADLIASRARVVAATDETRRRIERDLHDGTQQNLVSIGLEMRAIMNAMPPELTELRERLAATADAMNTTVAELQEISRGLHPSILSRGGLKQALTMLARRSSLTVRLDLADDLRLAGRIEVTVYYIVAEALTNAAEHAKATEVRVTVDLAGTLVRLRISDDGVGGAEPGRGSGLSGLADRVTAIGGRMEVVSPPGAGTTLAVALPCEEPG